MGGGVIISSARARWTGWENAMLSWGMGLSTVLVGCQAEKRGETAGYDDDRIEGRLAAEGTRGRIP